MNPGLLTHFPRLYPIVDTSLPGVRSIGLEEAALAMVDGGARILQIRHKGHWPREMFETARKVRELSGATLIINDRADIAALLDAGLHAGQEDLAPADARTVIGPHRLMGLSTHNAAQIEVAGREPVDYLAIGPIFGTRSKANPDPAIGLERLRELRRLTNKPLVAIGGITRRNARAVLDAGADSVAVIADLSPDPYTRESVRERVNEWLQLLR